MGIIGNCAYVAQVDLRARIVWMCLPRFDSSSVFGCLLDPERGGELAICPAGNVERTNQSYITNTNVLQTELVTSEGVVRVTDCAPRFMRHERPYKPLMLVRKLEPVEGNPRIRVLCRPRGEYGALLPRVEVHSHDVRYHLGDCRLHLSSDVPLRYIADETHFVLNRPQLLVLTWGAPFEAPLEDTADEYLRRTVAYWRGWVRQCSIGRFYQSELIRSALVLKLHQYEDTGAIIASATTSLPEAPGTGRNWDYRYCWLRDAYYTLNAFSRISQFDEMVRFANFIENIAASVESERYPPVVGIDGRQRLPESIVGLAGYDGKGIVRVGNDAWRHVQNDVYGQVLYALLQLYVDERFRFEFGATSKRLVNDLLRKIEVTLGEPDSTLWEYRGRTQRHCYTALFHWVGSKAAVKIARALDDRAMLRMATKLVARSARSIEEWYDPSLQAYVAVKGSTDVDASLLQLVILHYLDPRSERAAKHVAVIEAQLKAPGGLMYRYRAPDDFGIPTTTFLACAFWYVEALAMMDRLDDALRHLDQLISYSNHLGLFSEDVDAATGGQWGNFPQTYSHVGLMNAVWRVTNRIEYPEFF
jgi:GH15 family glucan-1,4-alpha-glucosidase